MYPHGSTDSLPFATMGSGSLNAMAVFESEYKDDLTREEAIALVAKWVRTQGDGDCVQEGQWFIAQCGVCAHTCVRACMNSMTVFESDDLTREEAIALVCRKVSFMGYSIESRRSPISVARDCTLWWWCGGGGVVCLRASEYKDEWTREAIAIAWVGRNVLPNPDVLPNPAAQPPHAGPSAPVCTTTSGRAPTWTSA